MLDIQLKLDREDLWQGEPMLVTVSLNGADKDLLPRLATPGSSLSFHFNTEMIKPGILDNPDTAREGEIQVGNVVLYNVLDCYSCSDDFAGSLQLRAELAYEGKVIKSDIVSLQISRPPEGDEREAFQRLHHFPWANYYTSKYCGDTFDLVARWPESRYVKYCHYYSGCYLQNAGEWSQAIDEFKALLRFPAFALSPEALYQLGVCYLKLGQQEAAREQFDYLLKEFSGTPAAIALERKSP